jgi:thiosulfate reductase/polysulfide reductase chain A
MCGMCATRCPIQVEVRDGRPTWLQGNPNDKAMGLSLCAKGAAGLAFEYDDERPQTPLIRSGPRGSGKWREASWEEALDYIAEKLKEVIEQHGGQGVVLSDRGGPFNDLTKSFLKALGSPNYFNHDCTCGRNAHHAAQTLFGWGRKGAALDIKNTRHIILYGRNIIESLQVKEAKEFMGAMAAGAHCTYIDPRATLTATKATRFWQIRPNTEYALNLAIIHEVLGQGLYDKAFVEKWFTGLEELRTFVAPYTPKWAEEQTGIAAQEILDFVRELAADAPKVIFHPGWMVARHHQSFYTSRTAFILNALMGAIETPGGLIVAKAAKDAGAKGLNSLSSKMPKPEAKRVDGVGWKHKHWDAGPGLLQLLYPALETGDPYQVGAYIVYRHDPLTSLPDPQAQIKAFSKLKLLVSIDVNYSETGWFSDVILPEATYLERASLIGEKKGPKPGLTVRDQAMAPRLDSRPLWWIVKQLLDRLGKGDLFPFESMEDIWAHQLEGTGIDLDKLRSKGVLSLADKPIMWDRENGIKFKTASGKVEIISPKLTEMGLPSLAPYEAPPELGEGEFRLVFGRAAVHNHGHTMNNPLLHELLSSNSLWIAPGPAKKLGVADGDIIEVSAGGYSARGPAKVTPWIHPEAVFMLHGFGRSVPKQTRAFGQGMADQRLMVGLLNSYDPAGGGLNLTECVVSVKKA